MLNRRINFQFAILMVSMILMINPAISSDKRKGNQAGDEYNDIKLAGDVESSVESIPGIVEIDTAKIIKPYSHFMFGFTFDRESVSNLKYKFVKIEKGNDFPVIASDFIKIFKDEKLPMAIVALNGCGARTYWKEAVAPISERPNVSLPCKKLYFGQLEQIKAMLAINPDVAFSWHLNIEKGTPETTRQLIEFLGGDETTVWGRKRIEYGIKNPIKIAVWNLDGEYDYSHLQWSPEKYVEEAEKHIKIILEADPNAVIAAQGATAPWHKRQIKGWRKWNQTILKELGKYIQQLAFHPYYRGFCPTIITNNYMDLMDEDIRNCPNPDIKIYVSEHAVWPGNIKEAKQWYMTHALRGCLATSEWLNLMLNRTDVTMMNYHSIHSGAWHVVKRDKEPGKLYLTGIADIYRMYLNIPGKNIVASQASGPYCDLKGTDLTFSAVAITGKDDELYIFLTNMMPDTARKVHIKIKKDKYLLKEIISLSAPTMKSHNTVENRPIQVTREIVDGPQKNKIVEVPPKTLVRLGFKQQ